MNYRLKQVPEDFIVEEIPMVKDEGEGNYFYYSMEKKNYNTLKAIKLISEKLRISIKRIGWAGNKDKNALTKQLVSIQDADTKAVENLSIKNICLKYYGRGKERIYVGNLLGNRFTITIRNLNSRDYEKITENYETLKRNGVPNYFDEQRFGGANVQIGKALLERNFKAAANKIYRNKEMKDPITALKNVHNSVLLMYIHAYQSLMFNETLSGYIRSSCNNFAAVGYSQGQLLFPKVRIAKAQIPVVGFGTELGNEGNSKIGKIACETLKKHNLTQRDFVIKQFPNLSVEGVSRDAFVAVKNLSIGELQDDELNKNMKKCAVSFSLDKGSYATIVVRRLLASFAPAPPSPQALPQD